MTGKSNKPQKPVSRKLKIGRVLIAAVCICLAVSVIGGGYFIFNVYQETAEFDVSKLQNGQASTIVDADGETFYTYGSSDNGKRENVTYEDIPQVVIDAVVSAEDSRYFIHNGFDLPRIVKALLTNLAKGRITSGGSTITQQVIKKSYYPNEERTYSRKIGEIFLSMKASQEVSKEEIMELYLNKIYFGATQSSIGIAAASKYYFDKEVYQLTLPEAALLAGTLNSPVSYDPYYNLELATKRRDTVLQLMVNHGYITEKEKEAAQAVKVENMLKKSTTQDNNNEYKDYITVVDQEVKKLGYDPRETQMIIHTYIDTDLQSYCNSIANGEVVSFSDSSMQIGASVLDSQTGRIVAVIGGRNTTLFGTSRATEKQQPGSGVKPLIDYGAAYEYLDWCTGHSIEDKEYNKSGYNPKNWDGKTHGMVTIKDALCNSWNLAAIWTFDTVIKETGYEKIFTMMENYGIDMSKEEEGATLAIGGWAYGASPVEMSNAYSTVARGGSSIKAHAISYIEIQTTGEVIKVDEEAQKNETEAVSDATAFMIKETMLSYAGEGNYSQIGTLSQTAAKTGTTNKSMDSWMNAYNPDYSISVWCGYDKHSASMSGKTSITRSICYYLMKYAIRNGIQNSYPSQPSDVVQAKLVKGVYPYVSPSSSTPSSMVLTAWFKKGTTPTSSIKDISTGSLSSFTATLNSSNKINVSFGSNSASDEATQYYGDIVYCVDVQDASTGNTLYSKTLTSTSATLDYSPTRNVNVIGYYTFENATSITSNKITVNLGSNALNEISYSSNVSDGQTISPSTVTVKVNKANSSDKVTITLKKDDSTIDSTNDANASFQATSPGSYSISMEETSGTNSVSKTIRFTVEEN